MIKAIIFDCFGVLASDGWLPFRQAHFGNQPELLARAIALNKKVDAGILDYDDFIEGIAALANVSIRDTHRQIEGNVPDVELLGFIQNELKSKYKIGMLSNVSDNWLETMFSPEQVALFDATVLSYELGVIKPDPLTYRTIAARLGVQDDECIFIDDQIKYCQGAEAVGMQAIWFENFEQFKAKIEPLLNA
jgi:HAD superfamily hydrolase (TIGR01509 family)